MASNRRYAPRLPKEERREQLLDAALALIGEDGYGAVSMEAVARRAGVTKPVVYDAFGDRGALLRALLEREERRAMAAVLAALPTDTSNATPAALLAHGVAGFLEAVAAAPDTWRLILLPADGTPDAVRAEVSTAREQILKQVRRLVIWGAGDLGFDVDAEVAAHAIVGIGEAFARLTIEQPGRIPPARVGAFVGAVAAQLQQR